MPIAKKHQMRNLAWHICSQPWAIEPAKFQEILELLNLRSEGLEYTADEIQARLGLRAAESDELSYSISQGVAVLPMYGVLGPRMNMMMQYSGGTSTQQFGQLFQQALADQEVKAIVLSIDSPGGSVVGTEELSQIIYGARGSKPIVTHGDGSVASAAYHIGSSADEIVLSPSTSAGSIGVVAVHQESSRASAASGVTTTIFKAGQFKVDGNSYEPLTDQARQTMQQRVDDFYQMFVGAVARHRGVSTDAVLANYGQGKMLVASRAVAAGVADRIGTLDQVVSALASKTRSNTTTFTALAPTILQTETPTVDPRIKAGLVALGLIKADATDDMAQMALNAFFGGRGVAVPAGVDAVVAALGQKAPQQTTETKVDKPTQTTTQQTTTTPTQLDRDQIVAAERLRANELRQRGKLLGIDSQTIDAAIESGATVEASLMSWTGDLSKKNGTVVKVDGSPIDRINIGAVEALALRAGVEPKNPDGTVRPLCAEARPFKNMHLMRIAEATLRAHGQRFDVDDPDEIAVQFLQLAGSNKISLSRSAGIVAADGSSYNTPGMFPNLLSNLAGKILDEATELAEATFPQWASQLSSVDDFKPRTILRQGLSGELPIVPDGDDFGQSTIGEEANWIAVDVYGDDFWMTPRMMLDDDVDAFKDMGTDKQASLLLTINRLCVDLLTGNPLLPDGQLLFSAAHSNFIAGGSGGAPSQIQTAPMRQKMRNQLAVGGKKKLRLSPDIALVPTTHETAAEQTFLPAGVVPVTDATINTFRGKITPIVEPMLDDASTAVWYALRKAVRTIVYMYQKGFEGGKRTTYFKQSNNCQVFRIEGRVGAAVNNWRGVVQNPGA